MTSGKGLSGQLANYWRCRISDMRVICYIDKGEVSVLVSGVGHRSEVYDDENKFAGKAADDPVSIQKTMREEKKAAQKDKAQCKVHVNYVPSRQITNQHPSARAHLFLVHRDVLLDEAKNVEIFSDDGRGRSVE